jgi:hypothetical protein
MSSTALDVDPNLPDLHRLATLDKLEGWLGRQHLSLDSLRGPSRVAFMVEARRTVAKFLRQEGWSYPQIGEYLGRDHTTVMHLLGARRRQQ